MGARPIHDDLEARVREGVKALFEQILLTTTVAIRVTEKWALQRYLNMELLEAHERVQTGASEITQRSRR